jgi:hypothetical protein
MVRLSPCCFSASASVATAMRVMECSSATMGSTERAKVSCTGPRTWPQLTPVDMTAPKVRTSKKFWHIHCRASATSSALPLRLSLPGFLLGIACCVFSSFFRLFVGRCSQIQCRISTLVLVVQDGLFPHVDLKALFAIGGGVFLLFHQATKLRTLRLSATSDQAVAGFGVQARQVARVRVAVGVAVLHIETERSRSVA